jgi:hypothetical protein
LDATSATRKNEKQLARFLPLSFWWKIFTLSNWEDHIWLFFLDLGRKDYRVNQSLDNALIYAIFTKGKLLFIAKLTTFLLEIVQ